MRKRLMLPAVLTVAACLSGAGFAAAQAGPPPPPPPPQGGPGGPGPGPGGPGPGMRGMPMHGMHGMRGMSHHGIRGARRAMWLAERLSAMETLLGIRPDQLDAWRAFTAAAINFVSPLRPKPPAEGDKPDDGGGAFALAERMADRAIARADRAKALKDAIAALRQKLTPEQLERVKSVEAEMRGRFHGRGHGPMHGPGGPGAGGPGPDGPDGPDGPGQDGPPEPDQQ